MHYIRAGAALWPLFLSRIHQKVLKNDLKNGQKTWIFHSKKQVPFDSALGLSFFDHPLFWPFFDHFWPLFDHRIINYKNPKNPSTCFLASTGRVLSIIDLARSCFFTFFGKHVSHHSQLSSHLNHFLCTYLVVAIYKASFLQCTYVVVACTPNFVCTRCVQKCVQKCVIEKRTLFAH